MGVRQVDGAFTLEGSYYTKDNNELSGIEDGRILKDGVYVGGFDGCFGGEEPKANFHKIRFNHANEIVRLVTELINSLRG